MDVVTRFLAKVDRCAGPKEPERCWEWRAGTRHGYGAFGIRKGKVVDAHRFMWQLASGQPIPSGLFVLHRCDNRRCVRPSHLFLGTARDNTQDMLAKGRCRSGEHNRRKTHCPQGHPYTGCRPELGWRYCKTCQRNYMRARRATMRRTRD